MRFDVRMDFNRTKGCMVQGDALSLPFKNETFGFVYMKCVLEHLPNPGLALKETLRILKPKGQVMCITDNAACLAYHWNPSKGFHEGHRYSGAPGDNHYMLFTPHHLLDLAQWAGFQTVECRYESAGTASLLARTAKTLGARPFIDERLCLVATKGL